MMERIISVRVLKDTAKTEMHSPFIGLLASYMSLAGVEDQDMDGRRLRRVCDTHKKRRCLDKKLPRIFGIPGEVVLYGFSQRWMPVLPQRS